MLIETHCHVHDPKAFPNLESELKLATEYGVGKLIVVGVNPSDWGRAVAVAEAHDPVFAVVGWHPNYTADYDPASLGTLRELMAHPKVCALGEIGLDYHWDYSPRTTQFEALRDQLDLAAELEKPVVFHAREAYSDLLDVLERRPGHPYLLHCFAGDKEEAERAVALGCYFGVDGPVSYKSASELRDVIRTIPTDRLVIETDSPYMTPVPYRGKPNRPAYVKHVAEALAETLGMSFGDVAALTTANAERFFGI